MSIIKDTYHFLSTKFQNVFLDYKVDFKPRFTPETAPHKGLLKLVEAEYPTYEHWIDEILKFSDKLAEIKKQDDANQKTIEPLYNNGFLPGLDIAALYTVVSKLNPAQYIEVGSGNSTKVVHKARVDQTLNTHITSIDPFPRVEIDELADKVIRQPLEAMSDFAFLESLQENDVLFIDNSHRCLPNSDATVVFLEMLPLLPKGVIVHIHDIYIPYDYPQFMCDRAYSEQYVLAAMILSNPKRYKTLFPCFYVSEEPKLSGKLSPLWDNSNLNGVERHGGSYWVRISE